MLPGVLIGLSLSLFLVIPSSTEAVVAPKGTPAPEKTLSTTHVITETNKARTKAGLSKLKKDTQLMRAAKNKANDMATKGYFSHTTPSGQQFTHFITGAGYRYTTIGENIAIYFSTEKEAVASWLNSPPHRENILNANYRHIGVGVAWGTFNGRSGWFGVQIFGSK
jgi:uncharacterized protein YkwD